MGPRYTEVTVRNPLTPYLGCGIRGSGQAHRPPTEKYMEKVTMTETTMFEIDESTDSQVAQWYKRLMNQTTVIDEKLDAGSEAATKRKYTTDLMEQFKPEWEQNATAIQNGLASIAEAGEMEKFAGIYIGLLRTLTNNFGKQYSAFVDAKVAEFPEPSEQDQVSAEERATLSAERSELAKQLKTIVEMAKTFGEPDAENWELPKKRGATGPRSKRALYEYTWTVDGQEMPEDDDNPKGVSELLGFDKVSEFTQALRDAKINTTKPDPEFTVSIKGKQLVASRVEEEAEEGTEEVATEAE